MLNLKPLFKRTFIKLFKIKIMKLTNFVLGLVNMLAKNYLLLLIYITFIVDKFNMPTLSYWELFFILFFISFSTTKGIKSRVLNNMRRDKKNRDEEIENKVYFEVIFCIFIWLNIGIVSFLF